MSSRDEEPLRAGPCPLNRLICVRAAIRVGTTPRRTSSPFGGVAARQLCRDIFDNYKRAMASAGFVTSFPFRNKEELTDFLEHLPTQRVATSLKHNYVKQTSTTWKINHLRDIEALSVAIPYTDAVVTDADVWDAATHRAPPRHGVWHSDLQEPHRCGDLSGPLNFSLVSLPRLGRDVRRRPRLRALRYTHFWYRYGPSVLPGKISDLAGVGLVSISLVVAIAVLAAALLTLAIGTATPGSCRPRVGA